MWLAAGHLYLVQVYPFLQQGKKVADASNLSGHKRAAVRLCVNQASLLQKFHGAAPDAKLRGIRPPSTSLVALLAVGLSILSHVFHHLQYSVSSWKLHGVVAHAPASEDNSVVDVAEELARLRRLEAATSVSVSTTTSLHITLRISLSTFNHNGTRFRHYHLSLSLSLCLSLSTSQKQKDMREQRTTKRRREKQNKQTSSFLLLLLPPSLSLSPFFFF
mmetsp:Transcript_908/g.2674  ORF Transcript_908/g.2674 Transcript_908/m.2674 type:complete len:218 (-) Transcript_908:175-828(-)